MEFLENYMKAFRYALREENALLFNTMLSECGHDKDYIRAVISRGEYYSAESLFILDIAIPKDDK
jgi:hypothetical protein